MDIQLLEDTGLTNPQAAAYRALVRLGESGAPKIAAEIGESRSNAYKVLDKLCELGLATKDQQGKRVRYFPANPAALEQLIKTQAEQLNVRERKLKAAMPDMLDYFFTHSEQPGIRFFRGEQGMLDMYMDQIRTKQTVYFIRGHGDIRFLGADKAHRTRNLFSAHDIDRYCIIQDVEPIESAPDDRMPVEESDKIMRLHRTWVNADEYDEPVEWVAYGDKLAILSFGQEMMGLMIESPQVARAFRKLYKLLDNSIRQRPGYKNLPKKALYTRTPIGIKLKKNLNKKSQGAVSE